MTTLVSAPEFADLTYLVRPRRVAVVGASGREGSLGRSTYENLRDNSEIPDGVFAVNPGCTEVLGDPSYPAVSDIPGDPVDVAVVLVAAGRVPEVVDDCAGSGVKHLVLLSSGFSEAGPEGKRLQAQVLARAREAGIRIYGPNSPGLANVADRALLSMSPVAAQDRTSGCVGLVTQGGGIGRAVMQWMDRGLGIGLWCSPGNEADLDVADFINHMLDDDRLKVVGAVVEGFNQGPKFLAVAAKARRIGKPIVILKIGRSEYGQESAASHTASIAGNDAVASAVFDQHAVVRVDDIDELGETLMLFSRAAQLDGAGSALGRPGVDPGQTCVFTFSGGAASLVADQIGAAGLTLAEFSDETLKVIRDRAPDFGFVDNPVDLTTDVFTDPDLSRAVLNSICADQSVGSILLAVPADYGRNTVEVSREAVEICAATGTLLVPVWMSPRRGAGYELLEKAGTAPFASSRSAVLALARLSQWRRLAAPRTGSPKEVPEASVNGSAHKSTAEGAFSYPDSVQLLLPTGVRFPQETFETDASGAAAAAERIGGPVAIKLSAPGLIHKTEVGGVRLGVLGGQQARAVFSEMTDPGRLAPYGFEADGAYVQEMIGEGVDLLLSAHNDEVFGPVITLGAGGVDTELAKDVLHLAVPFDMEQLGRALRDLRIFPLIQGFRGALGYDVTVLGDVVTALAEVFTSRPDIAEIEINPLRLVRRGDRTECFALDAVVLPA
ncbi:acetate--CoA ligase family protein [Arthrobacter sp. NPDC058127]|uniref:acetate--CoA ligase family protein n=1 Tax=Arthrobacter sp. NPDC058127 TaxID=3346351 RepID=UPI0036F15CBF